jgi:glutathione S-transferase
MKLYYSPGACSMAVHIALSEAGIPVDLVMVDLATHKLADGTDYYTISPRGYVPLLELDDGSRHTEASAWRPSAGWRSSRPRSTRASALCGGAIRRRR